MEMDLTELVWGGRGMDQSGSGQGQVAGSGDYNSKKFGIP